MKTMKKPWVIFMMSILFVTTACAGNKDNAGNESTQKSEKEAKVIALTQAEFIKKVHNFQENKETWKFEGGRPAIIDFYATWCGPCKAIAPILEELAQKYDGKIDVYKVDVDKEKELAAAFSISSIPAVLFIPMKDAPRMQQGAMPKEQFEKIVTEFLLK